MQPNECYIQTVTIVPESHSLFRQVIDSSHVTHKRGLYLFPENCYWLLNESKCT